MKKGFTLAEVLITLAIVGIISVLVIPNIINNIEKHRIIAVLKRAYSDLHTYLKDFDYRYECNSSLINCTPNTNEFRDKFAEYLQKEQGFKLIAHHNRYKNFNGSVTSWSLLVGATPKYYLESPRGYAFGVGNNLNDTYSIFENKNSKKRDYFRAMIWIYTKPSKIPRIGHDTFNAFIMNSEKIVPNGASACGNSQPPYGWTYYCKDWHIQNACNHEDTNSDGYGCLSRIIEDGWKINYF